MNLVVLGGTRFVGRQIVAEALARGHRVDVVSRGRTPVPEGVGAIRADRDGDLSAIDGTWDAAIDVSGYLPRQVRASAERLRGQANRYVFISSVSAYADLDTPNIHEDAPLAELDDPTTESVTSETYGGLKVACERVARDAFDGSVLSVRPTFVVGPRDYTDRFTSWLRRVRRGGRMVAPADPALPLAFIDVRDLGRFTVDLAAGDATGAVDASGPAQPTTWGEVLATARELTGSDARFAWLTPSFLEVHGVEPSELPMVVPFTFRGAAPVSLTRAQELGLQHTPVEVTIRDTLAWDEAEGQPQVGLSEERERALLKAWDART